MSASTQVRYILDVDKPEIKVHDLRSRSEKCYVEEIYNYVMLEFDNEKDLKTWLQKNIRHVHVCKHCLDRRKFPQRERYKQHLVKNYR